MDNYKSIGYSISIIHRYTQMYLAETLKDLGIHGAGQMRIVLTLSKETDGMSQDHLARLLMVDKGTLSRMISPLVKNKLVERKCDPDDRRAYLIRLTGQAASLVPEIQKRAIKWTKILSRDLTEEELEFFFRTLDKLGKNALRHIKGDNLAQKKT